MAASHTQITPYRMTAGMAEKYVRELAEDTSNIIWGGHGEVRSTEREISYMDALRIMREGMVMEKPVPGKHPGEWKCKIVKKLRGNRDGAVVTVIMAKQKKLKVVTVEWEDLR